MAYPQQYDFERTSPYSRAAADDCLAQIANLLPKCHALRTDRFVAGPVGPPNHLRVMLEGENIRQGFAITPALSISTGAKVASAFNLDSRGIDDLLDVSIRLADLNASGSWCLRPSKTKPFAVTRTTAFGKPIDSDSYLAETCEILAEEFSLVGTIQIDHHITFGKGPTATQRRRAYMRFFDVEGNELAAIDTSGMPLHARQQILKMDDSRNLLELNLWRMKQWSRQIGATPDGLAEAIPILVFLASSLHVTHMQLR